MPLPLISASPPSALCSSMDRSQPSGPGPTRMMPSAPMPRRRSARRRTWATESRRRRRGRGRPGSRCPAPSCLVACTAPFSQATPRQPCTSSARSSSAWRLGGVPAQVMRGSRRNHDAWRRANCRVRRTASSGRPRAGRRPRRGPGARGSPRAWRAVAGHPRRSGGQRPHLLDSPAATMAAKRAAMRRSTSSGVERRARPGRCRRPDRPRARARSRRTGRPEPSVTSSARTTRRRLVGLHPPGRHRVERAQPGVEVGRLAPGRRRARPRARAATSGKRPGMARSSTTARRYRPGAADEQGVARHGRRCRPAPAGPRAWNSVTVNSSSGSTRSSRWCGTAARAVGVGLGGADVHAAVDAHGVDGDDLGVAPPTRQRECRGRLARRGHARPGRLRVKRSPPGCARGAAGRAVTSSSRPGGGGDARRHGDPGQRAGCRATGGRRRRSGRACPAGCAPPAWPRRGGSRPRRAPPRCGPTRAWWRASAERSITVLSRSKRSATTSAGDERRPPVGGPGPGPRREDEGERAVVGGLGARPRASPRSPRRSRRGSPTMMSVVTARSSTAARAAARRSR